MWVALEELFKAVLFKMTTGLVGWRAVVAKYLIRYALKAAHKLIYKQEVEEQVRDELKKYEKVVNDPNSSADDVDDAFDDILK